MNDPYKVLGVSPNASDEEIKKWEDIEKQIEDCRIHERS